MKLAPLRSLAALVILATVWTAAPATAASEPLAHIRVTMLDENGAPADLAVYPVRHDGSGIASSSVREAPGHYLISVHERGEMTLRAARIPGILDLDVRFPDQYLGGVYEAPLADSFDLAPGELRDVTFTLTPGVRFSGTASAEGAPVPSLKITVERDGLTYVNRTAPLVEGAYRTEWLEAGTYQVTFDAEPHLDPITRTVTLAPGSDAVEDLVFEVAAGISGRVTVDQIRGSSPVTAVWVSVFHPDDPTRSIASARVSPDGTYLVQRVPAGEHLVRFQGYNLDVATWWPGRHHAEDATPVTVLAHTITPGIDSHVATGGVISGNVYQQIGDEVWNNHVVRGATVHILRVDPVTGQKREIEGSPVTADNGYWSSPPLPDGDYTFFYYHEELFDVFPPRWWGESRRESDAITRRPVLGERDLNLVELRLSPRSFEVTRLAGQDRWQTAAAVSQALFPDAGSGPVVYLANGMNFPDALSAGPAAIAADGVLLTTMSTNLPSVVEAELRRLRPSQIKVIGGSGAVSDAVMARAARITGAPTTRLGGTTRWDTSIAVVRDEFVESGAATVFLATGHGYPDALAAGPAAGAVGAPVLLIDGRRNTLTAQTRLLLSELAVKDVVLVGGTGVVSTGIEQELIRSFGAEHVERLAGATRWETAVAVNSAVFPLADDALVASGYGFPDALVGGPLAGALGAPMYLAQKSCVPLATAQDIWDIDAYGIWLIGGTGVLDSNVERLTPCE